MKRIIFILIALSLLVGLTACASNTGTGGASENSTAEAVETGPSSAADTTAQNADPAGSSSAPESKTEVSKGESTADPASPGTGTNESTAAPESRSDDSETEPGKNHKSVLVAVFSATGTTKGVAEKIAAIENADLYEIKAAKEYSSADLNWNDRNSRSTKEQNDKSIRPEIGGEPLSLEGYTKIYIGYPIWWGEEPRILDTFVEKYDFSGITVIPFCTSSSSGIGRSGQNLADNAKSGNWISGRRFSGSVPDSELRTWIEGLQ